VPPDVRRMREAG